MNEENRGAGCIAVLVVWAAVFTLLALAALAVQMQ